MANRARRVGWGGGGEEREKLAFGETSPARLAEGEFFGGRLWLSVAVSGLSLAVSGCL
jgi:hypothetical protein